MLSRFAELGLAYLPANMVSARAADLVRSSAARLAPVYWAGFEIPLGAGADRVDFHQGIRRAETHLSAVIRHHAARGDQPRLLEFCRLWQDPANALAPAVSSVILEFDLDDSGAPVPALFFAFDDALDGAGQVATARELLRHFYGREHECTAALERCVASCRGEERVGHVGLMLSRRDAPIRVNVRNLSHARLLVFLADAGYPHSPDALERAYFTYARFVDRLTVCLDVGRAILPRVGLECTLVRPPAEDTRHRQLLDSLTHQGLCTAAQADAILAWPGVAAPVRNIDSWPESLLVSSLTRPPDTFSAVSRTISHIKIDCTPDGALAAKAYLGLEHVWLEPGKVRPSAVATASADSRPRPRVSDPLARAVHAAVDFLLGARHQSGWWRDYDDFPVGASDEWPSAYCGYVLATVSDARANEAAEQAWRLLERCDRASGGWGWSPWIAADADSTAWALGLARCLRVADPGVVARGERFLQLHVRPDGRVATWEATQFRDLHDGGKVAGSSLERWCESHNCVTAAALHVPEVAAVAGAPLARVQNQDGAWTGFWWPDNEFTTALAVAGLAATGGRVHAAAIRRAGVWAAGRVGEDGSVFSAALGRASAFAAASCLNVLTHALDRRGSAVHTAAADRLAGWLTASQRHDGAWAPSALIYRDPEQAPRIIEVDGGAVHTTATVLWALNRLRDLRRR